jgi:hypothetical protein
MPSPEATVALAVAAVVALVAVIALRRRFRWWILVIALLILIGDAGIWWILTPHFYNVTWLPRFRNLVAPSWCLEGDYFLVDESPDPTLEMAGSSSAVPVSVADYRAHPNDWSKSPAYQKIYGTLPFAPQSTILAVVPAGTPMRLSKIVAEYRPATRDVILLEEMTVAGRVVDGTMLFYDLPDHPLMPAKGLKQCAQ